MLQIKRSQPFLNSSQIASVIVVGPRILCDFSCVYGVRVKMIDKHAVDYSCSQILNFSLIDLD